MGAAVQCYSSLALCVHTFTMFSMRVFSEFCFLSLCNTSAFQSTYIEMLFAPTVWKRLLDSVLVLPFDDEVRGLRERDHDELLIDVVSRTT